MRLLPDVRAALAAQGVLGLHVAEEHGGAGYGLEELAVVAEELGRACAPGALVPGLLVTAVLDAAGGREAKELLPGLVDGSTTAGVVLAGGTVSAEEAPGGLTITGELGPVLGGAAVDLVLVPVGDDRHVVLRADEVDLASVDAVDPTRPLAQGSVDVMLPTDRVLDLPAGRGGALATVVFGAEAAGLAAWCLDAAVEHARVREQFGRPIGQFQGVKHRCAEMLVRVEQARAAAWDAARAIGDVTTTPTSPSPSPRPSRSTRRTTTPWRPSSCSGGIGFTWEHDAHWFLRRATTLRSLLGSAHDHRREVARLALDGRRRHLHVELAGDEADRVRDEVRAFAADLDGADEPARRAALADSGFQVPHWPAPWGRDASPVEQLVIDEELAAAGIERPNIFIGGWILPTIIGYGTPEQREQFIRPTLRGDISWCQLFSEPGAGSDLAAISTRAERVDGGWRITGQKVWTSLAHRSDWGLLIARTDPDAPKHDGITAFIVDMQHTDGLEIRPLREMTGNEMFNEVFFDGAFVPDEMVVGPVGGGWKAARNTLANERVAMSSGSAMGSGVEQVLAGAATSPAAKDPVVQDRLGALVAEGQVLGLLGFRTTLAQLSGTEPGASSSVRKLVGGHHARACADMALELLGPAGIVAAGPAQKASFMFLQSQCLTIAGGTTNVQLNVIAERLLGLPRDP